MRNGIGLLGALLIAAMTLCQYFGSEQQNPVTGETQRVGKVTPEQEISLGLQAAPEMVQQHGGLHPDPQAQAVVDQVGNRLVQRSAAAKSPYAFEFHLLADPQTMNAFALPGGQVFITAALAEKLESEAQLAGVLGHEIAHVIGRHGAEHIAKQQLTQGLAGAAVLASYDPNNPMGSVGRSAMIAMVGQMVNMRYGREDELESDQLGMDFMAAAGYDPCAMKGVMRILASGREGAGPPEFFSTHPNPENRVGRIEQHAQQKLGKTCS